MLEALNDSSTSLTASLLSSVVQDPVPDDLAPVTRRPEIPGVLLLGDGSRWEGLLFGACDRGSGELVFTTNMTGYQESLTDPSLQDRCSCSPIRCSVTMGFCRLPLNPVPSDRALSSVAITCHGLLIAEQWARSMPGSHIMV